MSETDPFSDAAFITRLNKLLSMLGSAQAEEADTARRKLIEYLGQYRLSFTDIGQRLRDSGERPSFTGGAREMSLERQLAIARSAKQEAVADANAAIARLHSLEVEFQQQTFEIGRLLRAQSRARAWTVSAWALAAAALLLAVLPRMLPAGPHHAAASAAPVPDRAQMGAPSPDTYAAAGALHVGPGEIAGSAAVQDLAIRLTPNDDSNVRAFLNRGERVVVQQAVRIGPQTWLLVRSNTGTGWVRAGDVER